MSIDCVASQETDGYRECSARHEQLAPALALGHGHRLCRCRQFRNFGRSFERWRIVVSIAPGENRDVGSLGQVNLYGVLRARASVVIRQPGAKSPRLDPDDRVIARVVVNLTIECLGPDQVFLDRLALAGERLTDYKLQEAAAAGSL